jgi:hypothetical protein
MFIVKTDGQAQGKGVVVTENVAEALEAVKAFLGEGGTCVISRETGETGSPCSYCGSSDIYRRRHEGTSATVSQCRACLAGWLEN